MPDSREMCHLPPVVQGPDVWMGETAQASDAWVHPFLRRGAGRDRSPPTAPAQRCWRKLSRPLTRDLFPLPALSGRCWRRLQHELEEGWGLFLLRGIPVERYSKDDLRFHLLGASACISARLCPRASAATFWGMCATWGPASMVPKFRGYTSAGELTYHADAADVTGLFCLQPAKQRWPEPDRQHLGRPQRNPADPAGPAGGALPALLLELSRAMNCPDTPPHYAQPVFTTHNGKFAARYTRTHMRSAQMMDHLPKMARRLRPRRWICSTNSAPARSSSSP